MHMTHRRSTLLLSLLSLTIVACSAPTPAGNGGDTGSSSSIDEPQGPIEADRGDRESVADAILESLARGDWQTLSTFAADTGVRFTPFTHVSTDTDLTLSPADIASFASDSSLKIWGTTEGSGEPIALTNAQYLARYVWDHDYRTAPQVRWNAAQDHGSMIDNVQDVYPGASVVEYHFPGFDPQYGGMDWRSLRLVLAQNDDGEWSLYGVIHDEWTP